MKPRSPTLQADSLPAEPQGKPKNTGPRNLTGVSCIAGRFFTNWAMREAQSEIVKTVHVIQMKAEKYETEKPKRKKKSHLNYNMIWMI